MLNQTLNKDQLHKYVLEVAAKSPCKKRKVGCVIVSHDGGYMEDGIPTQYKVISEGYNFHPDSEACELDNGETDPKVIHAEVAALEGFKEDNGIYEVKFCNFKVFVTHQPCINCTEHLLLAGFEHKDIEIVGEFMKFDKNKPRFALIPPSLCEEVAKVLTYGAKKYKPNNWRNTKEIESYISALERHKTAWLSGEEIDPESGLHHLSHMACNIAFLIELKHLPKVKEL